MEYRIFEARLAKLHEVDAEDMGALRARLRVLRSMGVPPVPKVGKGSRQEFSIDDLEEMHLALTMSEFGLTPARIAMVMGFVRSLPSWRHRDRDADEWLVLSMRANAGKLSDPDIKSLLRIGIIPAATLRKDLADRYINNVATWHAVLDLRRIARDVDQFND